MTAVRLDELEHATLVVDDGAKALVARATGMIHLLDDDYMDEEAPVPADADGAGHDYVVMPPASQLGIGDPLVFRFAATHLADDQAAVRALFDANDIDGFARLLDARGATASWQHFRDTETKAALRRWCAEHGLQVKD